MTISSTTRIAGPFIGTGVATVFPFTFKVFTASDLQVVRLNTSTGAEATLVLTSDYTVSLNQNQDSNPGGSVTLTAGALASGFTLTITSDIANLQPTDITNQGGFYPEVIEDALDRATIQIQQISDIGDRTLTVPISDGSINLELPPATQRANSFLAFDASGIPFVVPASGAGAPVGSTSSALVSYTQGGGGSITTTVQSKLRETASVKDFGAVGDGVTDDTAAFTTAASALTPNPVFVPSGTYLLTGSIGGDFYSVGNVRILGGEVPNLRSVLPSENAIINGDFRISQRGTSFTSATLFTNADDSYVLDRWYILSDTNDVIDVSQEFTVVPVVGGRSCALDVETINRKFGIAQIIESTNCRGLIGKTVTLSFKAKVSSTTKLDNIKCAIVAWSGTVDTVTSDIVSAWGVEGTNPTLIANATYENTPANLNVTTSWQTYSVTANVDTASTNNIVVFIWSDVTDTTLGDFVYIADVKLEPGLVATPYVYENVTSQLASCQRYFNIHVNTSGLRWSAQGNCYAAYALSGDEAQQQIVFPSVMRISPTITIVGTWSVVNSSQPSAIYITFTDFTLESTATVNGACQARASGSGDGWYSNAEM